MDERTGVRLLSMIAFLLSLSRIASGTDAFFLAAAGSAATTVEQKNGCCRPLLHNDRFLLQQQRGRRRESPRSRLASEPPRAKDIDCSGASTTSGEPKDAAASAETAPVPFLGFTNEEREGYLKKFGEHQLSVLMMESPPFEYFDVPSKGFIAYRRRRKSASGGVGGSFSFLGGRRNGEQRQHVFALGDPVCGDEDVPFLIGEFLARHPGAIFVQVSKPLAANALAAGHGYSATPFGATVLVDLASWNLGGKKKQTIRTAVNTAKRQGITIKEVVAIDDDDDSVPTDNDRREIARRWLGTRTQKEEIGFLVRNPEAKYQRGVRTFYAFDRSTNPIGFCQYDPMHRNDRVVGYLSSVCRGDPGFGQGLSYAINARAIEVFRNEAIRFVDLGLCPFCVPTTTTTSNAESTTGEGNHHGSGVSRSSSSPAIRFILDFLYNNLGGFAYGFQGLRFAKTRYCGEDKMQYVCTPTAMPAFREVLSLLDLMNNNQ